MELNIEPRAITNPGKFVFGRRQAILGDSGALPGCSEHALGRSQDVPGRPRGSPSTLGRFWNALGRSQDALESAQRCFFATFARARHTPRGVCL